MAAEYRRSVRVQQKDIPVDNVSAKSDPAQALSKHDREIWIQGSYTWMHATLPEESPCLLTGVTYIAESVVVCDNENKTVKRFSVNGKFIEELFLTDPCGICSLKNGKDVVVTEPEVKQLTICTLEGALTVTLTVKTEKKYQCVTVQDENFVVGCSEIQSPCVDYIDRNGTILRSVPSNRNGDRLFRSPASLAYARSGELLISDPGTCSIICFNAKGDLKFKLQSQGRPSAVCVDAHGRMYMAHYDSNLIYRLSASGEVEGVAVSEKFELKCPLAMCVSNDMLVITEETPSDRIFLIKVS